MDINEMIDELHSKKTLEWISDFLNMHSDNCDLSEDEIDRLKEIISMAQTVYNYSGNDTGISDEVYDILYEKLDQNESNALITTPVVDGKIGYHKFPSLRGTLDKIYYLTEEDGENVVNKSRRGLPEWVTTSERKIKSKTGKNINLWDEDVYIFPKWDGVSCVFEFKDGKLERALTRGFTETNEAQIVTHIFEGWAEKELNPDSNFYGKQDEYAIKTEIMMSEDDLEIYNELYKTNYKNSRSIVSSIMNSDEKDNRVKYLKIMSLRESVLENNEESLQSLTAGAFNQPFLRCKLSDTEKIKQFAFANKNIDGLRCDGAVIYIINPEIQKILGRENNKQKFEVAFKFTEEIGYSKVKNIKFTMGLFGSVNPVLEIKPIKLKGNTIQNISLGSIARFNELNLAKGDKVKILYDIIPYCVMDETDENCKRSDNVPFEAPDNCPECGEQLELKDDGAILYCTNKKCPCRKKGRILNYFNKMHIDGISYATVDVLYNEGFLKSIEDVYKLEKHRKEIEKLDGFGKQSVKLMIESINQNREVPEQQLLGSIGIEGISTKTFEKVLWEISYDELIKLCEEKNDIKAFNTLIAVNGIKEKTAIKIVDGIKENLSLIHTLEDELVLIPFVNKHGHFSVCFTKVRNDTIEKYIVDNGGEVTDSVTKKTDLLVVPMTGVKSSKVSKAEKYSIPIISIDEAINYISKNLINKFDK